MATPKPEPKMPPPVIGEGGVLAKPVEGLPFGCSTIKQLEELGVPCITLLLIQA
jgi:hypothetical protein